MIGEHRNTIIDGNDPAIASASVVSAFEALADPFSLPRFVSDLNRNLADRENELIAACRAETGMAQSDAAESIQACFALLEKFDPERREAEPTACPAWGDRKLEIRDAPWGVVLAILPRNAFLYLALSCLVHALKAGNAVILRMPGGESETASILAAAMPQAGRVVLAKGSAGTLLQAFCIAPAPGLLHYFGGSGRIPDLFATTFAAGKGLIADGEGNTWAYVDASARAAEVADIIAAGATRYSGQTCTSINGAILHPDIYSEVTNRLIQQFGVMPLSRFASEDEATRCVETALRANGSLLAGGSAEGTGAAPTLIGNPALDSELVRDGVFGPVLWIMPGSREDFRRLWQGNRYPLCAAVFGETVSIDEWTLLGNLARLVVNGDPSLEDPLEPWGGYPSTGNNPVSGWLAKYRRPVQVDQP